MKETRERRTETETERERGSRRSAQKRRLQRLQGSGCAHMSPRSSHCELRLGSGCKGHTAPRSLALALLPSLSCPLPANRVSSVPYGFLLRGATVPPCFWHSVPLRRHVLHGSPESVSATCGSSEAPMVMERGGKVRIARPHARRQSRTAAWRGVRGLRPTAAAAAAARRPRAGRTLRACGGEERARKGARYTCRSCSAKCTRPGCTPLGFTPLVASGATRPASTCRGAGKR